MTQKPKRPPSVWISQIIIGLYATGMVLLLIWGVYSGITQGVVNADAFFVTIVMNATFITIFGGAFIGLAKGERWGRWLGVAALSILAIGAAITQTSRRLSGAEDGTGLFSPYMVFSIIVVVGLALLVYLLAAGDAAEHFFNGKPVEPKEPITEPPPPPTFSE
jgi:peptidoglycan/LPS O-acetylase OafA/YrhL